MSSSFSRTLLTMALALAAGLATAGFAAAPALAGEARQAVVSAQPAALCKAESGQRKAAATGFRLGTIGVPATPILH